MSRRRRPVGVRPPALVVVIAVVGLLVFFVAPLAGLVQRAPWGSSGRRSPRPTTRTALRLSLECSLAATGLAMLFGLPIAWLLARTEFRGQGDRARVRDPAAGAAAGRRRRRAAASRSAAAGSSGQYLDRWFDITLPFTTKGVILAETFVAMPFLIITVEAALRSLDTRYEDAGATLGASRWTVLRRITLPAIAPSLAAGAALTWARALGEFGATITFAGNFKGVTQTLPLAVYLALETDRGSAIVLSLVLLAVSITVLARRRPPRVRCAPDRRGRFVTSPDRPRTPVLDARVELQLGTLHLDVELHVDAERARRARRTRTAPGKSSLLRAIAGLAADRRGHDPTRRRGARRPARAGSSCRPSSARSR